MSPGAAAAQFTSKRKSRRGRDFVRITSARPESVVLSECEWWLPDLAQTLEMPRPSLTHWFVKGWVRGRKLPGLRGRLILWADNAEVDRLKQLRQTRRGWSDAPYLTELTTPK